MECWLYEWLENLVDEKTLRFLRHHKKNIRFTSYDSYGVKFEVENVGLHITYPRTIRRIANIKVGATA